MKAKTCDPLPPIDTPPRKTPTFQAPTEAEVDPNSPEPDHRPEGPAQGRRRRPIRPPAGSIEARFRARRRELPREIGRAARGVDLGDQRACR